MVNISTEDLINEHERLKVIISLLQKENVRKDLLGGLAQVNKFFYENMIKSMLEKDINDNYVQSDK